MERRRKNWGTLAYTFRATSHRRPHHSSSPNLETSSRSLLGDDDFNDDYGFITKSPPAIPPPPRPQTPLEFDDEHQKRVKEYQNNLYWENIKQRLTRYYNHRHESSGETSRATRSGISNVNNSTMETSTKFKKTRQHSTVTQSVPVQSSAELDEIGRIRKDSGSTLDLLDQVCEVQDCCERLEDFEDDEDIRESEKVSRLCVKCLVRYYNGTPSGGVNERSKLIMSRVSLDKDR